VPPEVEIVARLLERFKKDTVPHMMKRFGYKNPLMVPRLEKIVVSKGVGKAIEDKKFLDAASRDLALITGQKPLITKAKKSVSAFKVRKGMPTGCKVTLRGRAMYEFLDRLVSVVLPRIRDFRGLGVEAFDGHGNYNLGVSDQVVFPEVNIDEVEFIQGLNIVICIRNSSDEESFELLSQMGMPFQRTADSKLGQKRGSQIAV